MALSLSRNDARGPPGDDHRSVSCPPTDDAPRRAERDAEVVGPIKARLGDRSCRARRRRASSISPAPAAGCRSGGGGARPGRGGGAARGGDSGGDWRRPRDALATRSRAIPAIDATLDNVRGRLCAWPPSNVIQRPAVGRARGGDLSSRGRADGRAPGPMRRRRASASRRRADREAARLAGFLELIERDAAAALVVTERVRLAQLDIAADASAGSRESRALRAGAAAWPRPHGFLELALVRPGCRWSAPCRCDADGGGLAFGLKAAPTPLSRRGAR